MTIILCTVIISGTIYRPTTVAVVTTCNAALYHVTSSSGLHGVVTEPPGCCSLSVLAASLHHPLSVHEEAASAGVTVPPLDQTHDRER